MDPRENRGEPLETPPPPVADHELVRCIGRGGYGEVWLARSATGAWRAVKIIHRRFFASERPYEREFRGLLAFESLSRQHDSQVDVLHVGRDDAAGCFFYVMELGDDANGAADVDPAHYQPRTLRADLDRLGRLPLAECIDLGLKLTAGLAYLHENGLIHRDVKPSNIIYVRGTPRLTDIGLVAPGEGALSLVGTLGYLPPEGAGSAQADLYGLGKVLYEASTGKNCQQFPEPITFGAEDGDLAARVELNEIVLKACATDPQKRYRNAAELRADLKLLEGGKSVRRIRRLERRVKLATRAAALICLAAALALFGYLRESRLARQLAAASEDSRARAVQLNVEQGINRMDHGEFPKALLWFVEALRLAERSPGSERVHRVRIASMLQQCPRLLAVGHSPGPFYRGDFSPDGRTVAIGGGSGVVTLHNLEKPAGSAIELKHPGAVRAIAFSPDGQRLATGCDDGRVRLWGTDSGQLLLEPLRHEGTNAGISKVVFSPDGRLLATATRSGEVRAWDVKVGTLVAGPLSHGPSLGDLDLSPDGLRMVTGGDDGEVWVWQLGAPERLPVQIHHRSGVERASFSKDGRRILTASSDGTARVWDASSGVPLIPVLQHRELVFTIEESPDCTRILTAGGEPGNMGEAMLWEAGTGRLLASLPRQSRPVSAAFSPDGRRVITASVDGDVRVWDSRVGDPAGPVLRHGLPVTVARFAPDSRRVLTAAKDGVWRVWDLACEPMSARRFRTRSMVCDVKFTRDGRRVVSGEYTTGATLLDLDARELLRTSGIASSFGSTMALSPDDRWLAIAQDSAFLLIFDARTGGLARELPTGQGSLAAAFSPDGTLLAVGGDRGQLRVWENVPEARLHYDLAHPAPVNALAFSSDGRLLATGCGFVDRTSRGEARIHDARTGRLLTVLPHGVSVCRVSFSPDSRFLLTASSDSTDTACAAHLWDVATSKPVGPPMWHGDGLAEARFSPDGRRIVTAGEDAVLRIWEAGSGQPVGRIMKHRRGVRGAAFSPDSHLILSGSADGTARLWDAETGMPVSPSLACAGFVRSVGFSPDGFHYAVGSGRWSDEGTARLAGETMISSLRPNDWPVADLELLARVWSGFRLDPVVGELPLGPAEVVEAFRRLLSQHPEVCAVPPEAAAEWHRQEAEASAAEGNQVAQAFHERLAAR